MWEDFRVCSCAGLSPGSRIFLAELQRPGQGWVMTARVTGQGAGAWGGGLGSQPPATAAQPPLQGRLISIILNQNPSCSSTFTPTSLEKEKVSQDGR